MHARGVGCCCNNCTHADFVEIQFSMFSTSVCTLYIALLLFNAMVQKSTTVPAAGL